MFTLLAVSQFGFSGKSLKEECIYIPVPSQEHESVSCCCLKSQDFILQPERLFRCAVSSLFQHTVKHELSTQLAGDFQCLLM